MIQIQASASNADDAAVKVTTEDLEGVGRSLMISLDCAVIAYFTGVALQPMI
mgnify:CR=1 FL=1